MQDDTRPHRIKEIVELLAEHFRARVSGTIFSDGTGQEIDWTAYSPDLNPLDYLMWSYLKDNMFQNPPKSLDALQKAISTEIRAPHCQFFVRFSAIFILSFAILVKVWEDFENLVH